MSSRRKRQRERRKKAEATAKCPGGWGAGNGLLETKCHARADCRIAARLIAMGVVDDATAKSLLIQSFDLAEAAAAASNTRHFVAAMLMPIAAARLELTRAMTANCRRAHGLPAPLDIDAADES